MNDDAIVLRQLAPADRDQALEVINAAARWYREFLPPGELHDPEMTIANWERESARMRWFGAFAGGSVAGELIGVMALERVRDVALLRHAYVPERRQRAGVGSRLVHHLESAAGDAARIVVGTYAANYKARSALERLGYRQSTDSEAMLRTYYEIPEDRLMGSVTYEKVLSEAPPGETSRR